MRVLVILILLLITANSFSQEIYGKYYGKFKKGHQSVEMKKGEDGKMFWEIDYDSLEISIQQNGDFTLKYDNFYICAAAGPYKRFCTGTYKINGDTLILKSKYSVNDFCRIKDRGKKRQIAYWLYLNLPNRFT